MAEFHIWVSTYGLGGCGRAEHSGGLVAEGDGVFVAIQAWLVGGMGAHLAAWWVLYPLLVRQVALSPCQWASALDSVGWGIFRANSISMGVYSGHWVVAVGRWAVLWVFSWTVSRNPKLCL